MTMPATDTRMLDAALAYAAIGWYVVPLHSAAGPGLCTCRKADCQNVAKHPRTQHGLSDASIDPETIRKWWGMWPKANVAIVCGPSRLVVLDVDPRHGGDESYQDLVAAHGQGMLDTINARTGSGGGHYVFKAIADSPIGNINATATPVLGVGVDVRAQGGYIVAPPSLHGSGKRYEWLESPFERTPSLLPLPVFELLTNRTDRSRDGNHEPISAAKVLEGVGEGERDQVLFQLACKLRYADVPVDWAYQLVSAAAAACTPAFPASQARKKVDSAYTNYPPGGMAFTRREDPEPEIDPETGEISSLFVWANELDGIPEQEWVVEHMAPKDALCAIVGGFGAKKTFVLLDMACSIATGREWHGRPVVQGPVVYIYSEGLKGLRKRVRAWEEENGQAVSDIAFVPRAIRMLDPVDLHFLVESIKKEVDPAPSAIFIDTLARSMAGGDENNQKDMGLLIDAADQLRRATGACVWFAHHLNRGGEYRGSSALPGALDVMIEATATGDLVTIRCEKLKDEEAFLDIKFLVKHVGSSLVLTSTDDFEAAQETLKAMTKNAKDAYGDLAAFGADGASWGDWKERTMLSKDDFSNALSALKKVSLVYKDEASNTWMARAFGRMNSE